MREFAGVLADLRCSVRAGFESRFPPEHRQEFDTVRKAMLVGAVLEFAGANVPEARELIGEVMDLVMKVRTIEEVTPALRHWL